MKRREFLRAASIGLAGGWAGLGAGTPLKAGPMGGMMGGGGMGGGGMGGGGMGGGVIDPPVGAAFRDPAEMPQTGHYEGNVHVVEVNLESRIAPINVNGVVANLMTYNGAFPAPTIRVRQGDLLRVTFKNSLPNNGATDSLGGPLYVTNLHTHGLHVSPLPPADFVMYDLHPGETRVHEYDTSLHEPGTLCFYHPHRHLAVAEQLWRGLAGAIVTADEDNLLAPYETHLMILKDITLNGSEPAPHSMMGDYMQGKEGNVIMVNGQVNPKLSVKPGQVQRWRILNASTARFYRLSLEGHSLYLIGTDGGLLDKPYQRSELLLSPGERVDVLVKASTTTGNYRLRSLPYARMGMMQSPTITLLTFSCSGAKASQSLPASINPDARRLDKLPVPVPIAADRTLVLSMGMGRGYINGMDFDVKPYEIMSNVGTYERWTILNQSNMDHPFHQHVNPAQVLSVTGGDNLYATIPAWKDVTLVPMGGSVTLLVPVMDYDGMCMFHCHILEHEDIGMMGMWHLMGGM